MKGTWIRVGHGGHRVEHWSCYVVPYIEYVLGRLAHHITWARLRLDDWHWHHAHGAPRKIVSFQSPPQRATE